MNNTTNVLSYTNEDSVRDGYPDFEASLKEFFNKAIQSGKKLFKTNVEDLHDIYLSNLPEEAQQHYTCNACRHFINRFGGLVTIDENGVMESAMWNEDVTPTYFKKAVKAMKREVLKSKVDGIFIPETKKLGQSRTGEWTHLHVEIPKAMVHKDRLLTVSQVMAEKIQDFQMLTRALLDFSEETVDQALALIQSETMYRSDRVLGVAQWFKKVHEARNGVENSTQRKNIVWLAVATAPTGFTHIRSSMIGTLLDDINDGLSSQLIARRFEEKMNPSNFMRSQSAPTLNAKLEAEKVVEKNGLASALRRRYATLDEVPTFLWKDESKAKQEVAKASTGIFGKVITKEEMQATPVSALNIPSKVMTWDKFQRTVMPTAESVEVLVDNPNRLMALVTASDETAQNILQWNNPFSWYYHGGIDGEIKRRVESQGGRYEDNEIRVSLIWENYTDLDLHCITPSGEHIYFGDKHSRHGGYLDIDMNAGGKNSLEPVENIRWSDNAPIGRYKFNVHNFAERGDYKGTPFKVELEVNGQVYSYHGQPLQNERQVTVFEFDYVRGQQPQFVNNTNQLTTENSWNVESNKFVKVNGITNSPNLWGNEPVPQSGTHVFFLLEGVKDASEGKGRGFFNETLKSELRQIRKTLEAYTASTPIEGADEATACGVGYSKDGDWDLTVKVTSGNSTRIIKIDRWD